MKRLESILRQMKSVLVAYSGGADSAFLLKAAVDALGRRNVLAVTAKSPTYQASELKDAKQQAKKIGARHIIISTKELDDARFASNPANRCYYCKSELFRKLKDIAKKQNIRFVIDASNRDDLSDYRPGSKAKRQLAVRSPLQEAGFGKADIRRLSRKFGLSTWSKPAMACLASRIPYGEKIDASRLERIEKAEDFLGKRGFRHVRVRCHGDVARIEVPSKDIKLLIKPGLRDKIVKHLKALGFVYVAFDMEGYRTGSLNETLRRRSSA